MRSVARTIEYKVDRQVMVLELCGVVENEMRSFDIGLKETITMREKEAEQNYWFMPELSLPPLRLCDDNREQQDMIIISLNRSSLSQPRSEPGSVSCISQLVEWPHLLD